MGVLHLVEDPFTGATIQADEEPVYVDLQRLAAEAASKGREVQEENQHKDPQDWLLNKKQPTKGKNKAKKEDWVVGKRKGRAKTNSGSALPQRRSERVFIKDSVINYADNPAEEETEKDESPVKENPRVKSPTMTSIPLENLSSSTIAKISEKESEKDTEYELESNPRMTTADEAGKCPTCEKTFNRQNFYFRRHMEKCAGMSSSSGAKTEERRECPVCCKSYIMIGRGQSYYNDHLKACQASALEESQNNKSTGGRYEQGDDNANIEREMMSKKSGGEIIAGETSEEKIKLRRRKQIGENDANKGGISATEVDCK